MIPVHRWVTVHCAHVGHCAVCTGHRKTAISELDVLLNAIKETSVVHTGERILSDSVQMYNCTHHCTVAGNQCNCSPCKREPCNQDTVRLNSGAPAQLSITHRLCFTFLCRCFQICQTEHYTEITRRNTLALWKFCCSKVRFQARYYCASSCAR